MIKNFLKNQFLILFLIFSFSCNSDQESSEKNSTECEQIVFMIEDCMDLHRGALKYLKDCGELSLEVAKSTKSCEELINYTGMDVYR